MFWVSYDLLGATEAGMDTAWGEESMAWTTSMVPQCLTVGQLTELFSPILYMVKCSIVRTQTDLIFSLSPYRWMPMTSLPRKSRCIYCSTLGENVNESSSPNTRLLVSPDVNINTLMCGT